MNASSIKIWVFYLSFFFLWEPKINTSYRAMEANHSISTKCLRESGWFLKISMEPNHGVSTKWPRESDWLVFNNFIKFKYANSLKEKKIVNSGSIQFNHLSSNWKKSSEKSYVNLLNGLVDLKTEDPENILFEKQMIHTSYSQMMDHRVALCYPPPARWISCFQKASVLWYELATLERNWTFS